LCTTLVGADDQRLSGDGAQGLKRLSQPHVVGEEPAEARLAQEVKPCDAAALVRTKLRGQVLRELGIAQPFESRKERRQARKSRRVRLIEIGGQARDVREHRRSDRSGLVARGEKIRDARAEA
jgi:hypothetical protein